MKILEKKYIQPLYKIKEFAFFVGLTVDTLLFYEKIGLFLPFQVNNETGYRYYAVSQLGDISCIIQLKNLGLTLEEIKEFLSGNFTISQKIDMVKTKIKSLQNLLQLCSIFQSEQPYSAYFKQVPEHIAFCVKTQIEKSTDLLFEYEKILNKLLKDKIKIKHPYNFYTKFYDNELKFTNNNIEIFAEVLTQSAKTRIIPPRKYICTLHYGDYKDLPKAYAFLLEYCDKANIKIIDYPTEQYIESFCSKDSIKDFMTEIRFAIE